MDNLDAILFHFLEQDAQVEQEEMLLYFEEIALYESGQVEKAFTLHDSAYLWDNDESEISLV